MHAAPLDRRRGLLVTGRAAFWAAGPSLSLAAAARAAGVHPDRLVGRSARERAYAASHSANLNDAWTTLRDPLNRALYLCQLLGIDLASRDGRFADAPQLLQENMELHEALMEAAGDMAATAALHPTGLLQLFASPRLHYFAPEPLLQLVLFA